MKNYLKLSTRVILLTIVTLTDAIPKETQGFQESSEPIDNNADLYKTTPKIVSHYGYPVEPHQVTTEDGYILGIYRIPHGKNCKADPQKKPLYLQHGFAHSSADWVLAGPNISKAFFFADEGYDVWLGNIRGNTYSRRHKTLSPDELKFWDFSFHEMGLYDVPATIDYILKKTNNKKLLYIGHSMGTTMFYVMSILRPEYNDKILGHISLAPVAYFWRTRSLFFRAAAPFANQIKSIVDSISHGEILSRTPGLDTTTKLLCTTSKIKKTFCLNMLFFLFGKDKAQIPPSLTPAIVEDIPAGVSIKTFVHYEQLIKSKRFCQYDYGRKNPLYYNTTKPPDYNISDVNVKVVLIYSNNDLISQEEDVLQFYRQLPTALVSKVNYSLFTHEDFLWAKDVRTMLDNDLLEILNSFQKNEVPNIVSLIPVKS